jgi:hypothetical protein
MVIFKESIIITRSSQRKRAKAHPVVAMNIDTLSPLLSRACSSTSSDTHHVLWLVGVEAFAGSSWFIDTLVFSMESATREIKRRG